MGLRFYVYETVDEYVENINALIKAVDKLNDCYLIIRFRPTPSLSTEDLKKILLPSRGYSIHPEGSFEDFLLMADLLVSYSSTTIEEALQNRIPVLQYDPQGKYCHVPCQVLARDKKPGPDTCYFVKAEEDLAWALSWIVENHLHKSDLPESAWRRHTFSDDETEDIVKYFGHLFRT